MRWRVRLLLCCSVLGALLVLSAGCIQPDVAPAGQPPFQELEPSAQEPVSGGVNPEAPAPAVGAEPALIGANQETDSIHSESTADDSPETAAAPLQSIPRVDLVYFHTASACGCMAEIGDVIETAVSARFPDQMEQKTVNFQSVVSDDPKNASVVRMYGSQPFDLFLVTYEGGEASSTPLYEMWAYMNDYDALGAYVVQRVEGALSRITDLS
jgi:hypothetical protein